MMHIDRYSRVNPQLEGERTKHSIKYNSNVLIQSADMTEDEIIQISIYTKNKPPSRHKSVTRW